uniref:Membrane-associated enzyme, PAP2 (Acid phosphatase) superfamily n=1 Tax=Candidatus Kentrum sp. DK TaxID=2126562 RepID=A0A450SQR6_9GAMM|nr:MAG: Membrane-associated enzyme, PAP2 (acid phosphatase) superfamily [Candidatus Kentron sp. DK]
MPRSPTRPTDILPIPFVPMLAISALLLLIAVVLQYSGPDIAWISQFFDPAHHAWPYKEHWFFKGVIHTGGRWLYWSTVVLALAAWIAGYFRQGLRQYRKHFLYFLIAALAGPAIVLVAKDLTHLYTPWDLQLFGGAQPYIRLFDPVPDGARVGHAFPAGHASLGYAFFSLYFVAAGIGLSPRLRWAGFLAGLGLGLAFGLGQQIRGAHFPSHDLFSLVICWVAAMAVSWWVYGSGSRGG